MLSAGGLAHPYRLDAVRAHPLELAGDRKSALVHYRLSAGKTTNLPSASTFLRGPRDWQKDKSP
jgi:hypothetical protein